MSNIPPELGVVIGGQSFDDLDYTDNALLAVDSNEQVLPVLKMFEEMAGTVDMHPSWPKTKIQNLGAGPSDMSVTIGSVIVESVDEFAYLGSLQSVCAGLVADVRRCMGIAGGSMSSLNNIWLSRRNKDGHQGENIQA